MPGTENRGGLRRIRWALWGLVALAVLVVAWIQVIGPRLSALPDAGTANLGRGDYRLAATDGSAFTQDSLKGAPSAVPCTSTIRPAPVITKFASVSASESSA